MLDRRRVGAAQSQRRLDRTLQARIAEPPTELQQLDHRPRPILAPMTFVQPVPELVIAVGPASSSTPLVQRFAAGERAWLMLEHVQVVLQVQHLLVATV